MQVEAGMVESVQETCRRGVLSYPTVPRERWVLEWPGQVVLVVTAIFWTRVRKAPTHPCTGHTRAVLRPKLWSGSGRGKCARAGEEAGPGVRPALPFASICVL